MRGTIAKPFGVVRGSVLVLLLSLLLAPAATARGMVFEVSRGGLAPSYLVGTMHSEDPRVMGLMSEFGPLIGQVDTVVVELVPDAVTMLAVGAAMLLPAEQSLRATIGAQRFRALTSAAERRGLSTLMLDRLQPWAAAVTLGMPAVESGRFLDMEIYLEALRHRRRVVGLETAAEQLSVFTTMPRTVQLQLLDAMVKNIDRLPTQLEQLTAAYIGGKLDRLDAVAREQYVDMSPEITRWFDDILLNRRNARMLERLSAMLDGQRLLVAVGAMHLSGDSGLLVGLRRLGFRVARWGG